MSSITDRRQRFRAVLAGPACIHPGSVFDPMSARIAEDLGFEVGTRGSTENGLVRDVFARGSFTLNFGERWFIRRRID